MAPDTESLTNNTSVTAADFSPKFLETLLNLSPDILYIYDLNEQKNIYSNEGIQKILGYTTEEIKTMGNLLIQTLMHPDDFATYLEQTFPRYAVLKDGEAAIHRYRMKHKDGLWHYLEANEVIYTRNSDGSPSQIFGVIHDITEQRQTEEIMQEAALFNENIIAGAQEGIIVYDKDFRYKLWNPFMEQLSGLRSSDVLGRYPQELFPESKKAGLIDTLITALEGKSPEPVEFSYEREGNTYWVVDTSAPLRNTQGEIIGIISTVQDITQRKRMENHLKKSEEKYRKLFTTMTQGVVYQDSTGKITSANPAAERILGLTLSQMQGRTSMDPQWRAIREDGSEFPGEEHPISIALRTGKKVTGNIHGIYHPEKKCTVWIKVSAVPLFNPGETTPYQAYSIIEDITEQRLSEEKYMMLFREMLDGFALHEIICDDNGNPVDYRFLDVNPSFERMTGLKKETIVGRTVLEALPETEEYWIRRYGAVALTGKPDFFENFSSAIGKYFEVTAFRPAPNRFACIFVDVTQRRKTEELLKNTQKLESLGILAGGIAHDFNNLLGGIYGYTDLALEGATGTTGEYLEKSLQTIERARSLTQQLLTFAKGGVPILRTDTLFPLVKDVALFALSGSNVSIRFDIQEDLRHCKFDRNQIGQVVENIIINAQQAMPLGGSIIVSAGNVFIGEREHALLKQGTYCRISITDTGIGIPKEYMLKIFDPFFTTKTKGHGLGLATCYSIVSRHGGSIDVESEQGKGSTFHIFLPATDEQYLDSAQESRQMHSGTGIFILMDDEVVIQETIAKMLTSFGYTVAVFENGKEAVNYFIETYSRGEKIAGILLDMTVPGGMGGIEAARLIRDHDGTVPVYVVSGYAEDSVMANPATFGFTASICKPFRKSDLAELLNKSAK